MPYNSITDSFHTKKLCNRLSSSKVQFYTKTAFFRFGAPFRGLKTTYNVHLRLIEECVVDFLLVLIKLFR